MRREKEMNDMSCILVSMHTPSNHRCIYSYALDRVFLWCQIARATVTVTGSLNSDLVQDRRPFGK